MLLAVPTWLYIGEANKAIGAAESENRGLAPIKSLLELIRFTQQHRGLTALQLGGDASAASARQAKRADVARSTQSFDQSIARGTGRKVTDDWLQLKLELERLLGDIDSRALSGAESFARHTALIQRMTDLLALTADDYGLSLDPEADGYFLIMGLLDRLPALTEQLGQARAGEHGKGFAVVAGEVRKLAERSQVAAQEIGEMAGSSVAVAEKAGRLLTEMVPAIRKTSNLVQEITAASEEQSSSVGQINTSMTQLNRITQQSASSSEELAATAEEMSGQAQNLQQLVAFFKLDGADASRPAAANRARAA